MKLWYDPTILSGGREITLFSVMTPTGEVSSDDLPDYLLDKVMQLLLQAEEVCDPVRLVDQYFPNLPFPDNGTVKEQAEMLLEVPQFQNRMANIQWEMKSKDRQIVNTLTYQQATEIYKRLTLDAFLEALT
jgi:hypothetical protein